MSREKQARFSTQFPAMKSGVFEGLSKSFPILSVTAARRDPRLLQRAGETRLPGNGPGHEFV